MWKTCGYVLYQGEFPITARYLVHDTLENQFLWTDDSNKATIFPTMEYVKLIFPKFDEKEHEFRLVVMTDEPVK